MDVFIFQQKRQQSHYYLMVPEEISWSRQNVSFMELSNGFCFPSAPLLPYHHFPRAGVVFSLIRWILQASLVFFSSPTSYYIWAAPRSQLMNSLPMISYALISFPHFLRIMGPFASSVVP